MSYTKLYTIRSRIKRLIQGENELNVIDYSIFLKLTHILQISVCIKGLAKYFGLKMLLVGERVQHTWMGEIVLYHRWS